VTVKRWVVSAALGMVVSGVLAGPAQAETCAPLSSERGPAVEACLIDDFTPSHPLASFAPYHVRLPSELVAVRSWFAYEPTLIEAGPPGGMSTWEIREGVIPVDLVSADGTMQLWVTGVRPREPGKEIGPHGENAEYLTAAFTVAAVPVVTNFTLHMRRVGMHRQCQAPRTRVRRASSQTCRKRPRQIVVTYSYQSSIALTARMNVGLTNWVNGVPHPPVLFLRTSTQVTAPGARTIRLVFSARMLERRCQHLRHCTLVAFRTTLETNEPGWPEQELVSSTKKLLSAHLLVK
jgi:hypothetical protein